MASKARFYRFDLCDGHGCEPRIIAAQSKADAENVVEASISPLQKAQSLKHLGWCAVRPQLDQDACDVAFVATVEGKSVVITREHSSHEHLMKLFPAEAKEVTKFLESEQGEEL
jgi:hypothetical protein